MYTKQGSGGRVYGSKKNKRMMKKKKMKAGEDGQGMSGKKSKNANARKTYFRIKSAGNARPEKQHPKYRQQQRGYGANRGPPQNYQKK